MRSPQVILSRHGTHLYPFIKQPQLFIRQSAFVVALTEVDKDAAEYEEGQVIRVSDHVFDFGHQLWRQRIKLVAHVEKEPHLGSKHC